MKLYHLTEAFNGIASCRIFCPFFMLHHFTMNCIWLMLFLHESLQRTAQFYFSVMAHYANVKRFFSWCSHKPKRKRNLCNWTSFYSIKARVQFKTSFMQLVS